METPDSAAKKAALANIKRYQSNRAARPLCAVTGSLMAGALRSLAKIFENENSGNSVIVAFDGRFLTFDCNGLKTTVAATGTAWPARYELAMAAIADVLPIRLTLPVVGVGIWKSTLEIDRARCPGVRRIR